MRGDARETPRHARHAPLGVRGPGRRDDRHLKVRSRGRGYQRERSKGAQEDAGGARAHEPQARAAGG